MMICNVMWSVCAAEAASRSLASNKEALIVGP
jgi:hypothetical protein